MEENNKNSLVNKKSVAYGYINGTWIKLDEYKNSNIDWTKQLSYITTDDTESSGSSTAN